MSKERQQREEGEEGQNPHKQAFDASPFFYFNQPFPFSNNATDGNIPNELLYSNQIPDDLFQFVTGPLQTNLATTPPPPSTSPPISSSASVIQSSNNMIARPNIASPSASSSPPAAPTTAVASPLSQQQQQQQQQHQEQPVSKATPATTSSSTANTIGNMTITPPLKGTPLNQHQALLAGKKRKLDSNVAEPADQAVYTIIVGGRTFRLSWESLKSDGPNNLFVNYFLRQRNTRVMYIDRDADTFQRIAHHLRGYYVRPVDDTQNQDLLNDARYYGLQRLRKNLEEYLFVNVGGRVFRLSWDLLRKDGKSNFFTGPLMHALFTPHGGKEQHAPVYIDRDPDIFADIVNHLRGYTIHIKDDMHRKNLLKDAQYYVFRQLVEKLLTAKKTVDGFGEEGSPEVLLLLQDVRIINLLPTKRQQQQEKENSQQLIQPTSPSLSFAQQNWNMTQLQYKREGVAHALLVQVADFCLQIHYPQDQQSLIQMTMEMGESDKSKLKLFGQAIKGLKDIQDKALHLDDACALTVDDQHIGSLLELGDHHAMETCTKCNHPCRMLKLILLRGICGVHLVDSTLTLCAVRLEAISSRLKLNMKREFLPQ